MAQSERSSKLFTDKLYNVLKFIALVLNPALAALYFTLAGIWGLPNPEQVIGTIAAFDTFLGVILHLSARSYYKNAANFDGTMLVIDGPEKQTNKLVVNGDPADLANKKVVTFNVSAGKHEASVS